MTGSDGHRGDFYLYLSSSDNVQIFTENQPHNFHCVLEDGVFLEGKYECALTDICYYSEERINYTLMSRPIYLLTNFVKNSFTPVGNAPILRRFYLDDFQLVDSSRNRSYITIPEYHDVSVTSLSLLRLYIADSGFKPIQLSQGILGVTLHFRPKKIE